MQVISVEYPRVYSILQKDKYTTPTKIRFNNSRSSKTLKNKNKIPSLLEMRLERIKR